MSLVHYYDYQYTITTRSVWNVDLLTLNGFDTMAEKFSKLELSAVSSGVGTFEKIFYQIL